MADAALDEEERALWRAFVRAAHGLDRALEQRLQADAGLSVPEFDVLLALDGADGRRLRASALAAALGWDRSRLSHLARRMAERGLLDRAACDADARGTWVVLAEPGAAALARAGCGYDEVLRARFFDALGAPGRRSLVGLVERLAEPAGASVEGAPAHGGRPGFSQTAPTG